MIAAMHFEPEKNSATCTRPIAKTEWTTFRGMSEEHARLSGNVGAQDEETAGRPRAGRPSGTSGRPTRDEYDPEEEEALEDDPHEQARGALPAEELEEELVELEEMSEEHEEDSAARSMLAMDWPRASTFGTSMATPPVLATPAPL